MTSTKYCGGLGVLDPAVQQHALFYKCIDPFLFYRLYRTLVQQFLFDHLANQFQTANVLSCLLFLLAHPRLKSTMASNITLVCRTIDSTPCALDALLLPLRAIVDADCSYSLPRPLLHATVADFYEYHPNGHFLTAKQSRAEIPFSSNSVTRFRNAAMSGTCVFSPVSVQCIRPSSLCLYNPAHPSAILKSCNFFAFRRLLLLSGDDPALYSPCTSCKTFRAQITKRSTVLSVHQQTLSKAALSRFWRLALTTVQRNVLYRLLHRLIPTRRLLFHILPAQYPSSACEFCVDVEDIYHLFFRCPPQVHILGSSDS